MARLIPPVMCGGVGDGPPGEAFLFKALQALPDNWTVLHSLVFSFERGADAEADFVVISPDGDCIVIEVKSHLRIEFAAGLWRGNGKEIKDPFRQATNVMHKLRRLIDERSPGLRHRSVCRLVVFPFATFTGQSPEFRDWEYLDRAGLSDAISLGSHAVEKALCRLIDRTYEERGRVRDGGIGCRTEIEHLVGILRPTLRSSARADELRLRDGELAKALDDQREAIAAIEENPRCLITGPAGSGKTLLALRYADDLIRTGSRPLLLCFNRAISDELKAQLRNQPPADRGFVMTVHAAMLRAAGRSSIEDMSADGGWDSLSDAAIEGLLSRPSPFGLISHLVVDEAQDLATIPQCLDFFELILQSPLECARWVMFGDFDYQALYEARDDVRRFRESIQVRGSPTRVSLRYNCRNTRHMLGPLRRILPEFSSVYRGYRRECSSSEDCKRFGVSADPDGFRKSVTGALRHCAERNCRTGSTVLIFCDAPTEEQLRVLAGLRITERGLARGAEAQLQRVTWTTVRKAKGLEFDGVVLANVPAGGEHAASLLYTGCTRALTCVCVVSELGVDVG